MKEHFKKVAIGQIHTFGLTRVVMDHFKVGMGLKNEVVSSGTEFETREQVEARIKLVGIRPLDHKTKDRSSMNGSRSSSSSPPPSDQNRRRVTRGRNSRVPADKFDRTASSSAPSEGTVPPPPVKRKSTDDLKKPVGSDKEEENVSTEKITVKQIWTLLLRKRTCLP